MSTSSREVRNLGGGLVTIKGPIELTVEICNLILKHPFYFYDGNPTFLMGFDLITRAALTIDAESRCVWSKHTLRCHIKQDLADVCAKPTIQVNANPFLDTVPPSDCTDCEDLSEFQCSEQELVPLSMASGTSESFQATAVESSLPRSCRVSSIPVSCTSIEVGAQASEIFTLEATDFSGEPTVELSTESLHTEISAERLSTSEKSVKVDSNLNPAATVFVPENLACPCENLQSSTQALICLLYTSPSPRDRTRSRMPSSA